MIEFTIPLPPITKKNSQRIVRCGKSFRVLPSEPYQRYEEAALKLLPRQRPLIEWPVEVKALFYMPTRRRVDLTNLLEALDDVLVKARILDDDNCRIIASHDGSRVLYDKTNPRTEVTITRIEDVRGGG